MATFYQYLFNSQPHNPDPSRSSLDDLKQADAIPIVMKTWKELMKNKKDVGAKIYEYVLTKEISMSRLFMNSRIDQQSELFMAMLDRVVKLGVFLFLFLFVICDLSFAVMLPPFVPVVVICCSFEKWFKHAL